MDAVIDPAAARCPACGAPQPAGATCSECFDALLAYEAERPAAFGAVHHLTVATYFLQHPRGYGAEVLGAWRALVADALDGRVRIDELRHRLGRQFDGAKKVRAPGSEAPNGWPGAWPLHVIDVLDPREPHPAVEDYVARARAWAAATRATIDATSTATGER